MPGPIGLRHHIEQRKAEIAQDGLVQPHKEVAVEDRVGAWQDLWLSSYLAQAHKKTLDCRIAALLR